MRRRPFVPWGRVWPPGRRWWWALGAVGVVVALAYTAAFLLDEPMRRSMEERLNARLKGYEVTLGRLDFHPFGFSLDLEDLVVRQKSHPDPPVASIPRISASVEWSQLIRARVVGEIEIDRPTIHLNVKQARQEIQDPVPVGDRGWREALQEIYPLEINLFTVRDGSVVYTDDGPFAPLPIRGINIEAANVRNIKAEEGTYPSRIRTEAQIFERGRLVIDGRADFLADPHPAVIADVTMEGIELDYFKPLTGRIANVALKGGVLGAEGRIEYAPAVKVVDLGRAEITGLDVEYVNRTRGTSGEKAAVRKVQTTTAKVSEKPDIFLRIEQLDVTRSRLAFSNAAVEPPYRLFVSDLAMRVRNFTNQRTEGRGDIALTGKFLGTGPTTLKAQYQPAEPTPNLDLQAEILNADMKRMNEFWKAHAKFDVVAGELSLYTELQVRQGMLTGYVKPLLRNVDVYDPAQDRKKSVVRKAYEAVVGALSDVLENQPRDEIATRVDISGRIDKPEVNPLETAGRLVQNAFFKAILPGFERRPRGR
jgi:Domain of Unknown Function (DUF748)